MGLFKRVGKAGVLAARAAAHPQRSAQATYSAARHPIRSYRAADQFSQANPDLWGVLWGRTSPARYISLHAQQEAERLGHARTIRNVALAGSSKEASEHQHLVATIDYLLTHYMGIDPSTL